MLAKNGGAENELQENAKAEEENKEELKDLAGAGLEVVAVAGCGAESQVPVSCYAVRLSEAVKKNDQSMIIGMLIEISSKLSMAQEDSITSAILKQLITPLVQCLEMEGNSEIARTLEANCSVLRDLHCTLARHQSPPHAALRQSKRREAPLHEAS